MVSNQYIFQILKILLNFLMSMWQRGFVTKEIMLRHQKINLNIQLKKNEKSWNLKTLYGKHLLDF